MTLSYDEHQSAPFEAQSVYGATTNYLVMTPATPASRGPADRKAVLFCPACEHEAPLDGDWTQDSRGVDVSRTDLRCPECGQTVVSQPSFGGRNGDRGSGTGTGTGSAPDTGTAPDTGEAGVVECVRPVLQLLNAVVRHDVL
jgi:hypothetical protein